MFPSYPVSASSIPINLTPAEHLELVEHAQTLEAPVQSLHAPEPELPAVETSIAELTQQTDDVLDAAAVLHQPLQQVSMLSRGVVERVFTYPDLFNRDLLPGFRLLRQQSTESVEGFSFGNPGFDFELHVELLTYYAHGVVPWPAVLAYIAVGAYTLAPSVTAKTVCLTLNRACFRATRALALCTERVIARTRYLQRICFTVHSTPSIKVLHELLSSSPWRLQKLTQREWHLNNHLNAASYIARLALSRYFLRSAGSPECPPESLRMDAVGQGLALALQSAQAVSSRIIPMWRARLRFEVLEVAQCLNFMLAIVSASFL